LRGEELRIDGNAFLEALYRLLDLFLLGEDERQIIVRHGICLSANAL